MDDVLSSDHREAPTSRLRDYLWHRKRAKAWWTIAIIYWSTFAVALIFPGWLSFVCRPPFAYLIVLCFPPLIALTLSIAWQRQFFASISTADQTDELAQVFDCQNRRFIDHWIRDQDSWQNDPINPGSSSYRIRHMYE